MILQNMGLLKKYKKIPDPVKASLWFTICSIIQKGISFITMPIFTRLLSTSEYGMFSVYQSWYFIISIFATLNLSYGVFNNGLTKFNNKEEFTSSMLGLSTSITIVLTLIATVFHNTISKLFDMPIIYVYFILLECLLYPALSLWSARQRYEYKYQKLIVVTLIMAILNPITGIVCVLLARNRELARIASYVVVESIVALVFYIKIFRDGKKFLSKDFWKYALLFNIPLIPHYLSQTVLNQADRIMIGSMIGKSEAAIYSVAYNISMMMTIITTAINNSFIPYTYKCLKEGQYEKIRKNSTLLLIIIGTTCVFAMAFCPELIYIVGGEEYYSAIYVMPSITASVYFMFLYPLFGNIEFFYENTKFIATASCLAAVVNVILNYIFIGIFGYYAAGYTTLVCYIISALAHYYFHKKLLKKNLKENLSIYSEKAILIISVIVLIGMLSMLLLYRYMLLRYAFIMIVFASIIALRKKIIFILKEIRTK